MRTKRKKLKRLLSFLMAVVMLVTLCPGDFKTASAASLRMSRITTGISLSYNGKVKGKDRTWYRYYVGNVPAFCMTFRGHASNGMSVSAWNHETYGDSAKWTNDTDKSTNAGKYARIIYWLDNDKSSGSKENRCVYAQSMIWALREGATAKSALTQLHGQKSGTLFEMNIDDLYDEIFNTNDVFSVSAHFYETGKASYQKFMTYDVTTKKKPDWTYDSTSVTVRYRQRINIKKVNEDGKPVKGVKFRLKISNNKDNVYSYNVYSNGAWLNTPVEYPDDVDETDDDDFYIDATTGSDGMISFRLTRQITSSEWAWAEGDDASVRNEVIAFFKKEGFKYNPTLMETMARQEANAEVDELFQEISDTYKLQEISVEDAALTTKSNVEVTYYNGGKQKKETYSKRDLKENKINLTLTDGDSWVKDAEGNWPDDADGRNYSMATQASVEDLFKKASIKVVKYDEKSNDGQAHGDATLDGAKFQLYDDAACTKKATVYSSDGQKKTAGVYVTKDGQLVTDYLRCEKKYYLKEIEAPVGYLLSNEVKTINIDGTKYNDPFIQIPTEETIQYEETPVTNKVEIIKVCTDGHTGEAVFEEGAQFQVYLTSKGSYDKCDKHECDIITTDEKGWGETVSLWYGEYTVHQISTGGMDTEMVADFSVTINEDSDKREMYTYLLNDHPFQSYLKVVKKDKNTGAAVAKAGTAFRIYQVDPSTGKETQVVQSYSNGKKVVKVDTFVTDEDGVVMTVNALESGTYRVYEVDTASGYHISNSYEQVTIGSMEGNYTVEGGEDGKVYTITSVDFENEETYGELTLSKTGEQLTGFDPETGRFIYEKKSLRGIRFEVYAKEDIVTQDKQGTTWFQKGDLACTITTGKGAEFTSSCGGITGYSLNDEDGTITVNLPLGQYTIKEIQTSYGYVLPDQGWDIRFTWDNKEEACVLDSSGMADEKGALQIENARATADLSILKQDRKTNEPVSGAVFGLYAATDIYNTAGEKIVNQDTLLDTVTTDQEGKAVVTQDIPLMSKQYDPDMEKQTCNSGDYYFKELEISGSYYLDQTKIPVHVTYQDQNTSVISVQTVKANDQTTVEIDKLTVAGSKELPGCDLQITDRDGNVIISWTSGNADSITISKKAEDLGYRNLQGRLTEKGNLIVGGLLQNTEYTLTETRPADGYVTAEDIMFRIGSGLADKDNVYIKQGEAFVKGMGNRILMYDDTTKIQFKKIGSDTKELLAGAEFAVYSKGKKIYTFQTNAKKPVMIEGVLRVGSTYKFVETKAPSGYETAKAVKVKVKDTGKVQVVKVVDQSYGKIRTKTPGDFPNTYSDTSPKTGYDALAVILSSTLMMSGAAILIERRRKRKHVHVKES